MTTTDNANVTTPASVIEQIREAARLMRERAEKATPSADPQPGGWAGFGTDADPVGRAMIFGGPSENGYRTGTVLWFAEGCDDCTGPEDADVQHIAGWHPAVALAVADWLDSEANSLGVHYGAESNPAVKVARAYLGTNAEAVTV